MKRETRAIPLRLAFLFACLPLMGWWMTGLFDVDEGFYGAVVAEMNRRGEWITPYFNGSPWFEKPILLYWLAKPCMMLFGMDIGPRLPSVICTILLFVVCGFFVRKRIGEQAQAFTIFCLGSSLIVLALGRLMMTDAPLNLALTTAFLSFYESLVGDKRWRLLTAFCLGLGVLAKGPVAIILFILVAGVTLWRDKSLREQWRGYWLAGTGILLATVATWYLPCYLANGQTFVQKFLIEQNVGRFLGGDQAHSLGIKGLPFYIPIILLGVAPWGWIEWRAFTKKNVDDSFSRFLFTWAAVIFVFFTISSAKLPHYILPMIPPMAMLAAKKMASQPRIRWTTTWVMGVSLIMTLALLDPAQRIWYRKSGQMEAHYLVRKHPEIEVLYKLGKQEKELKTGTTNLQETSLPSLIMYLNKPVQDIGETEILMSTVMGKVGGKGAIVFTRKNRLDAMREQFSITPIEEGENFGVYEVGVSNMYLK